MLDARFSHLYFCLTLYTLQRGLPAIAGLLGCIYRCPEWPLGVVVAFWLRFNKDDVDDDDDDGLLFV